MFRPRLSDSGRRALRVAADLPAFCKLRTRRRRGDGEYSLSGFDQHRCIFVHIPKCGGTSVAKSLFHDLGGGHFTIRRYHLVFSKAEFENYFKFTIVRNPWDRLVSAYHFLKTGGWGLGDRKWANRHLQRYSDFGEFVRGWVNQRNVYRGVHFVPQFEFLRMEGHTLAVDFVGRFENIEDDFRQITGRLKVKAELELHNSRRDARHYRSYYDDDTAAIVAETYAKDIELFGYTF